MKTAAQAEAALRVQLSASKRLHERAGVGAGCALLSLSGMILAVEDYLAARDAVDKPAHPQGTPVDGSPDSQVRQ